MKKLIILLSLLIVNNSFTQEFFNTYFDEDRYVTCIGVDSTNHIFVGTNLGLHFLSSYGWGYLDVFTSSVNSFKAFRSEHVEKVHAMICYSSHAMQLYNRTLSSFTRGYDIYPTSVCYSSDSTYLFSSYSNSMIGGVHKTKGRWEDDWETYNNGLPVVNDSIKAVDIVNKNDTIFLALDKGLFRSTDNGKSWIEIQEFNDLSIKDFKLNNGNDLYFVVKGYSDKSGLYKNLLLYNNDILPISCVTVSENDDVLFATHNKGKGVFHTTDDGESWIEYNEGLDSAEITSLAVNKRNVLYVGTNNQGIFRKSINPYAIPETYYSISDGDWNDNTTWSLTSHQGEASDDIPTLEDSVIIVHQINIEEEVNVRSIRIDELGGFTTDDMLFISNELKLINSSDCVIDTNGSVFVGNVLEFGIDNKGIIKLPVDTVSHITILKDGKVIRNGEGYIEGTLIKYIPQDDFEEIMFEVGANDKYTPFAFDLDGTGGTSGYIGVDVIDEMHPEINFLSDSNFCYLPSKIMSKYWRMTLPSESKFERGDRTMAVRCRYLDPEDFAPGMLKTCLDLAYWRGWDSTDWQRLTPNSDGFPIALSNDTSETMCGDRKLQYSEADYRPYGTDTSTTAYNIHPNIKLGNKDKYIRSSYSHLIADFIVAEQGGCDPIGVNDQKIEKKKPITSPNPFSENTTIKYNLKHSGNVVLIVYNSLGIEVRELVNEYQSAGEHEVVFYGTNLPQGSYYYRLQIGNRIETGKLILLKEK